MNLRFQLAYGIFMKQASTESGKFAKVMGSVEDMINTNLDFMLNFQKEWKGCQLLIPQNIG
jgi:tubulin-specific chaperone A